LRRLGDFDGGADFRRQGRAKAAGRQPGRHQPMFQYASDRHLPAPRGATAATRPTTATEAAARSASRTTARAAAEQSAEQDIEAEHGEEDAEQRPADDAQHAADDQPAEAAGH